MDYSLRCNSLKCRTQLNDRAVVTTCSHIFCVPCSESLGLADANGGARVCPACETHLSNPDDAVVTQLNPTEDYKTSVLSGLSPSIIMECAGRGLSFYSYQTTQEIVYQEFLARSLTDKYSTLSSQMDKIIHDANSEIMGLRDKLSAMHLEQKSLEQKNHDLAEKFRDRSKQHQQMQRLYNSLKQQQVTAGMELAAEHDAEDVLHAAAGGQSGNATYQQHIHSRAGSNGSGGASGGRRNQGINAWESQAQGSRAGLGTSRSAPVPPSPSGHRTRLPPPLYGNRGTNYAAGGDAMRQGTPYRQTFNNLEPNVYGNSNLPRYGGMSAGVKVGRQESGPVNASGYGVGKATGISGLNIR